MPYGGPDGGDGGDGGDIYFVADPRLTSLLDVQYHYHWTAPPGEHGQGSKCHGKNAGPTRIAVPVGTLIRRLEVDELVADLRQEGQEFLAARGGKGGKGNARFTTSTRRAPKFAERGEPGEDIEYLLELKLIAQVGLVGLPNAGKSTLLAAISAAKPKIADYPFTTLSPNLGVARLNDYRTITVADIPGIIEGAAEGKGLGHDFLRHIERTQVLMYVIDLGDDDPAATQAVLESELLEHSPVFADRPRVVALNKADVPENRRRYDEIKDQFDRPHCISAATGEGVQELLEDLWQMLDRLRREQSAIEVSQPQAEYTYEAPFTVSREGQAFRVSGRNVTRAVRMTDFSNEEAVSHFQDRLRRMGVMKALKRLGAKPGDAVIIGDVELEYQPD